ncbi:hypothetical protein GAP52_071 [Cronobacter phage vB_CsaP_GAP52]|uniref:Uncharacterized protein n=1 Tax=Cronobacter phage vB_CsaP_GAP52 TaxID=1141137 RepID=K4F9T4_9CAUD|nr:hypothetical protein D858_gp043 [Cronobacter phage vB_CsaP_GAP52]AFC22065.1 hypothetical protein GAP52_071 [Cronobacter phage vB_CsaP_GAP52]
MFIITRTNQIISVLTHESDVRNQLAELQNEFSAEYHAGAEWTRNYYRSALNYSASLMRGLRVIRVPDDSESLKNLKWVQYIGNNYRGAVPTPDDVEIITDDFFTVESAQYEADAKVFATVVKSGLKSSGMEVILDPALNSDSLKPVSYYEDLIGTFARIKATTNIHGYGYATLFFSPEALGNIRVETQVINGLKVIW